MNEATRINEWVTIRSRLDHIFQYKFFFIVGCQKSGTTWVQHILDAHPEICCRGESCFGTTLIPPLAQTFKVFQQHTRLTTPSPLIGSNASYLMAMAMGLVYCDWNPGPNTIWLGEKTPEHAILLPMLDNILPDIHAIHIIRDPRDAMLSGWLHNLRSPGSNFSERFPTMRDYADYFLSNHWIPYVTNASEFGKRYPHRYIEFRYEDLLVNTDALISKILTFLNVPNTPDIIDTCKNTASFHQLSGGRQPGQEDRDSFFRKGIAGDWKNHLDPETLTLIENNAGKLMSSYGYESP